MVLELTHPDGRRVESMGNPVKFRGERPATPRYPPPLGSDTADVLIGLLGLSPERVAQLETEGAIYQG